MLTRQWHCLFLFSLIEISILILDNPKKLATASQLSFSGSQSDFSLAKMLLADNSLVINKQSQNIKLFQQLNLTPEQTQKINQIHRQYYQRLRKKRHTLEILQKQLSDMMVGTASVDLLLRKNQQLTKVRQDISALRFESMLATRETLTLQQRQKFRDLVKFPPEP